MAAVKASHEKEKIYANTVKYWSIIGSLLSKLNLHFLPLVISYSHISCSFPLLPGAALGAFGAALSYHYRQNTYKTMTDKYTEQVTNINSHVDAMKDELSDLKLEVKSARLTMQRESEFAAKHRAATSSRSTESWSGFLWRKSVDVYRYIVPRRSAGNQTPTNVITP